MLKESKMRWQIDIANKKALLLGELPVSNEEYSWLKTYFINYIVKSDNAPVTVDLAIALFLVQVAIREYTEGKYWDNLERTLDCVVPQARRTKANDIFYKTLVFYDLFVFPSKNGKMQYTEMIKAHAFVTNNYMSGFFDFINAYFETVLFRQLNKKDVSEDLAALSAYMKETLEDGDSISIKSKNDKVPKTYRLLKSTRSVIAYVDNEILTGLLYPVLKCVDNYYYDAVLPNGTNNRFNEAFINWCKLQESVREGNKKVHSRHVSNRKPYIFVNEYGRTMLVIPQQKFRPDECQGKAFIDVIFVDDEDEVSEKYELDVYKQWGLYISDELSLPLSSPFDHTTIKLYGAFEEPIKEFNISSMNYRILDKHNKETRNLKNGDNKLLIIKDLIPFFNENVKIINSEPSADWVLYTINCSIDSEIKIGEKTLRFTNKDYTDVEYENEESNESNKYYYTVKDIKGNDVKCTKTHPIITIYTDRMYENGIVIHVNNEKIPLKVIKTNFEDAISVVYDQNFKNKESIFINLERIYNSANGLYEVYADIPSKSTSYLICRYICFPYDLVVKRNRKIYRADHELSVKIEQSMDFEIEFEPLFNCETSDNYYVNNVITKLYKANAIDVGDLVSFKFYSEGTELVMNIPVPKFKFGGSVEKMECRPVYNWYKDIPDNMYVYFLGALSMKITFEWDNKIYQADGNVIDTCTFRFDMKEINDLIKSINNRSYMHLDISYYDGKVRNNSIMVQRQLKIEPYFNEESVTFNPIEKTLLININKILFKDRATLYAEIEDVVNKSIVYDGELKEGNNVISNIDSTRNYSIRPYMIEKNGLFGTVRTSMRWFFINGKKTISNISDYHITIRSIYNKGKRLQFFDYLYGIDFLTMSNDNDCVFFGRFYAAPYNQKRPDFKNKKIIGNIMMTINKNSLENERDPLCTIAMLETDYNEYVELYYDIERKMLISPNNKRLHSNNYGKFIPLYENETVFCLELRLRKERKDVIQTN